MFEQPINSLERFRKRSGRLMLETHAAGCGGVILRWRNPQRAVPLTLSLYSPGKAALFFDGAEAEVTGVDLAPGPHQLTLALEEVDTKGGLFLFSAAHDPGDYNAEGPAGLVEPPWRLVSQPDRTWLATLEAPLGEDWKRLEFDDSGWLPLARAVATPSPDWRDPSAHQLYWLTRAQAAFLALPKGTKGRARVWVRHRFVVPPPQTP